MPPSTPILYLTTSGQVGGAERCLLSLIRGLPTGRYRPQVVVGSSGPLLGLLQEQGIAAQVLALPAGLRRLSRFHGTHGLGAHLAPLAQAPGYTWRLRRAGRRFAPAIIHSNGVKMHYAAAWLKPAWQAPLVWHLHDYPGGAIGASDGRTAPSPLADRVLYRLASRVDVAIAISHAVADAYRQRVPALSARLRVVPNGVSQADFRNADGGSLRKRLGWRPDTFVIGMVAAFAPWKGHEVFLRAASRLRALHPGVRFLLVGDDIYDTSGHGGGRGRLEALAQELGLHGAVAFTGFMREVASAYATLDVLVHASTRPEPFGRTAIEAMAAGVPVIGAASGGVVEVIEDGRSGLLVPPGDSEALAAALSRLLENPQLRADLVEQGRRRVRDRFSEAAVGLQMASIYDELLPPPQGLREP